MQKGKRNIVLTIAIILISLGVIVMFTIDEIPGFIVESHPGYENYQIRSKVAEMDILADLIKKEVESYALEYKQWPSNLNEIAKNINFEKDFVDSVKIDQGIIYIVPSQTLGIEGQMVHIPEKSETDVIWNCKESTIELKYLLSKCHNY